MRGEPWRRKYASPGHPPGSPSPSARGGSAATRATSKLFSRRSAAGPNQLVCLGSSAMPRSNCFRSEVKNARATRASNAWLGSSCTSRQPRRGAQRCEVREERLEQLGAASEPLIMRDRARDLDGKPERARYGRGPSFKRRRAMRAIESGIDFDSGKHLRIAREERLAGGKAGLLRARNAPSCGPDIDLRGHAAILLS